MSKNVLTNYGDYIGVALHCNVKLCSWVGKGGVWGSQVKRCVAAVRCLCLLLKSNIKATNVDLQWERRDRGGRSHQASHL